MQWAHGIVASTSWASKKLPCCVKNTHYTWNESILSKQSTRLCNKFCGPICTAAVLRICRSPVIDVYWHGKGKVKISYTLIVDQVLLEWGDACKEHLLYTVHGRKELSEDMNNADSVTPFVNLFFFSACCISSDFRAAVSFSIFHFPLCCKYSSASGMCTCSDKV